MQSRILRSIQRGVRLARNLETSAQSSTTSSTVDPTEVEHFSRLSAQWWDEHGELKMLHRMNPPRVAWLKQKMMETRDIEGQGGAEPWRVLSGMRVLDVGCGGGLLSESLARLGATVTGVDAAASNIAMARAHQSYDRTLGDLEYRHAAVETLAAEGAQFDALCAMEVLEHVDEPAHFLKSCADVIKPGGHLFLSTISRTPFARLLTITMAENILRLVSPGTHTYSKFIKPSELIAFFQQLGWITSVFDGRPSAQEAEIRGIVYLPWEGKWQLGPADGRLSEQCNYLFWTRKPRNV